MESSPAQGRAAIGKTTRRTPPPHRPASPASPVWPSRGRSRRDRFAHREERARGLVLVDRGAEPNAEGRVRAALAALVDGRHDGKRALDTAATLGGRLGLLKARQ